MLPDPEQLAAPVPGSTQQPLTGYCNYAQHEGPAHTFLMAAFFFPYQMSYGLAPYLLNKQYALSQGQSSTLFVSQQHDRAFHRAFVLPCFCFTLGQPNRVFSPDTSSRGLLRYLKEDVVTSECSVMTMSLSTCLRLRPQQKEFFCP